jgi:hypothetical protein
MASLRYRLVNIGAMIVRHGHPITIQMAEVMVPRALFQQILDAIAASRPSPPSRCCAPQSLPAQTVGRRTSFICRPTQHNLRSDGDHQPGTLPRAAASAPPRHFRRCEGRRTAGALPPRSLDASGIWECGFTTHMRPLTWRCGRYLSIAIEGWVERVLTCIVNDKARSNSVAEARSSGRLRPSGGGSRAS